MDASVWIWIIVAIVVVAIIVGVVLFLRKRGTSRADANRRKAADIRQQAQETDLAARERERSEEHTSELQSRQYLVCRLLLEKKKTIHALRLLLFRPARRRKTRSHAPACRSPLRGQSLPPSRRLTPDPSCLFSDARPCTTRVS